jgi:hypothetical protein
VGVLIQHHAAKAKAANVMTVHNSLQQHVLYSHAQPAQATADCSASNAAEAMGSAAAISVADALGAAAAACVCLPLQAVVGDYIAEEADALDDPMRFHLPLSFGEQHCWPAAAGDNAADMLFGTRPVL